MHIETERLLIVPFTMDMAKAVHLGSLDEDTRQFLPDEVFETEKDAAETLEFLISVYTNGDGPLVYPFTLKDGTFIGYVQAVPMDDEEWEVGYHTSKQHTGLGYATEALRAFIPVIMDHLKINHMHGVCLAQNVASVRVLEKCGFRNTFDGVAPYQGQDSHVAKYIFTR